MTFNRKSNFATIVKFLNVAYTFKFSEKLRTRPIMLQNFKRWHKMLVFLLNFNLATVLTAMLSMPILNLKEYINGLVSTESLNRIRYVRINYSRVFFC